jgi:hypothetical protein
VRELRRQKTTTKAEGTTRVVTQCLWLRSVRPSGCGPGSWELHVVKCVWTSSGLADGTTVEDEAGSGPHPIETYATEAAARQAALDYVFAGGL